MSLFIHGKLMQISVAEKMTKMAQMQGSQGGNTNMEIVPGNYRHNQGPNQGGPMRGPGGPQRPRGPQNQPFNQAQQANQARLYKSNP